MINKILRMFLIAVVFLFSITNSVQAQINIEVSDNSAQIEIKSDALNQMDLVVKRIAIKRVLERYNSPLIGEIDSFMEACYVNNIDCYLVPSVAGLESTFGRRIAQGTYNPFGWGGGYMKFESWSDAIHTVASGLRENYIGRGATTVAQIGRIYAPPSTTWSTNVKKLMSTFEREEAKISNLLEVL